MPTAIELFGNIILFCLIFGLSATVDIHNLLAQLKNRKAILTGIGLQFVVLPFLGGLAVNMLKMDHAMGITLLVVTASPGGSYSNWWCSMFNADLALSVCMTAISTILSIVTLPINLLIYAKMSYEDHIVENLDWVGMFISLIVVISAILCGLICSSKFSSKRFQLFANRMGSICGVVLVVFSALLTHKDEESDLFGRSWVFYVGVAFPCVVGLLLSNIITSSLDLKKPERITVSIECCYQNVGIATSVALSMFQGDELSEALCVPLFYGLVEAVILAIYCTAAWKAGWSKAPPDENFFKMIAETYEIDVDEKEKDPINVQEGNAEQQTSQYNLYHEDRL